ncbi:MAG: hypothetical protein HP496_14650 [Nitrospira sp.]|nr:hypothetical protein [Nitrospira sp.]
MSETIWALRKPPMTSVGKIEGQIGEKTVVSSEEKIGNSTDDSIEERIGNWTGAMTAGRITGQIPAVNSVDLIGPTMLPVNMAAKGETTLDSCKMMDRTEESG